MGRRLKDALSGLIPPEELAHVYNTFDIVGDIAIVRLTEVARKHSKAIAEAIMSLHKNVKTVLAQIGPVCGDFRLRRLEYVAGEGKTTTIHKESGCLFLVDVEKCYFSPRLSYERMRIAKQAESGEVVVNMFAGVGCFSIIIAKYSNPEKVYSIDVNPVAVKYMCENVKLNRVYGKVAPVEGDAGKVIETGMLNVANRVLMPLPERAFEYLPYALSALGEAGGWVHYYDFEHARKDEDPVDKVKAKVARRLKGLGIDFQIPRGRVVRSTGPNWYQVVLDVLVKR